MGEDKKKKLLRKKALTLALMYMFFCMSSHINASIEKERTFAYELCDSSSRSNDKPFATYKNYNIYIGCEADINRYTSDPNNICIIDGRCNKNPNMKINIYFLIGYKSAINELKQKFTNLNVICFNILTQKLSVFSCVYYFSVFFFIK